jgi:hypothetical protein
MWGFWDQAKLISQIQRLRKQSLPLYAKYVLDNHQKLFSAALRQFGSWRKALIAADIEIPKYAYGSRLGILRALDDAVHGHSTMDVPQSLKSSAVYYFGSLPKAIVAAKRERTGSPKYRVTDTLSRMHRRKQPLVMRKHDVKICRWCVPPRSSSGWERRFAAGIDPSLYYVLHKWREPKPTRKRSSAYGNLPSSLVSAM